MSTAEKTTELMEVLGPDWNEGIFLGQGQIVPRMDEPDCDPRHAAISLARGAGRCILETDAALALVRKHFDTLVVDCKLVDEMIAIELSPPRFICFKSMMSKSYYSHNTLTALGRLHFGTLPPAQHSHYATLVARGDAPADFALMFCALLSDDPTELSLLFDDAVDADNYRQREQFVEYQIRKLLD